MTDISVGSLPAAVRPIARFFGFRWFERTKHRWEARFNRADVSGVSVQEMEHRPRWFMWTSLFAKVRCSIEVRFNDEVGERSGSWKGGCIGCGYDLRDGETPEQSLRRMETERKF